MKDQREDSGKGDRRERENFRGEQRWGEPGYVEKSQREKDVALVKIKQSDVWRYCARCRRLMVDGPLVVAESKE